MAETSISIRRAQRGFLETAAELQELDGRLAALAESIMTTGSGSVLPGELRGGAQIVRTDLLRDAIQTLQALGGANEEDVMRRRLDVEAATSSIAAFG